VATFTFTGSHNHQVLTTDSGRCLPTAPFTKAIIINKLKKVFMQSVLCILPFFPAASTVTASAAQHWFCRLCRTVCSCYVASSK